jgi:uncharacterized protein (TIGR00369 family)
MNLQSVRNNVDVIRNIVHPKCIVCSLVNTKGLHLKFGIADDGCVKATFQCDSDFEGYPGVLHGGVISSILDGAMGNCMFARGQAAVTVEITTRFRHPIVTFKEATVSARVTQFSHPLYHLEAEIVQEGKVKATAKGKFYDQPELVSVMEHLL